MLHTYRYIHTCIYISAAHNCHMNRRKYLFSSSKSFKCIQTPNISRVITCMLSDTPSRHLCTSQKPNNTTRQGPMQKYIPTRPKVKFEDVWQCLLASLGVFGCLWVSVGVCWCFVLSRYVLNVPGEVIRGYLRAFFGCLCG